MNFYFMTLLRSCRATKGKLFPQFFTEVPGRNVMEAGVKSLVEAMGIEPMSALQITPSATCLFFDYTYTTPQRHSILHKTACGTIMSY